jgi:aurora kinase, other
MICDMLLQFGLSIDLGEERANTRVGTLAFMAPEVLRCPAKDTPTQNKEVEGSPEYSSAVDSWACGALLYAMLTGEGAAYVCSKLCAGCCP